MATILVVDDRPVDREYMAKLLGYAGHTVLEAADGEQGLAMARDSRPELIVADILMPRMDGLQLVRELQSDPWLANVRVLIYSASYDSTEVRELTQGYGISVLMRPSEPEAILRTVASALERPSTSRAGFPDLEFDRKHLRLLGDKLHEKAIALEETNARLIRLVADLRAEVENRRRAEAEAAEGREWLRVVLSSIGDAVIATDDQGRISFLNPVAEKMTGWPRVEAVGHPLEEVFHIINEEHRGPVENPVARVLREGITVGLANHTVLIARDGTERPIDDCAAPIRDADDRMRGVVMVFHDVTARRDLERQLRDRADRLAEADRRKDEFLAMLAHELRNPLAPIRNSLYVLEVSPGDPQVVDEMRGIMRRQIEHLVRLVDDLLDVSRITRGLIVLRKERFDLTEVVRQAHVDNRRRAEVAGLELLVCLPGSPVLMEADPARIRQVIDNLLGNAMKFTDRGGTITVGIEPTSGGEVVLSVRDTGIGIDPETLPRIFEAFAQADRSLDRSRGGLGLGLALVRGLVELHGGTIQARSEGTGRGAELLVRLPALGVVPVPAATGKEAASAIGRRRILVIEDHRDAAETLRQILTLRGYEVTVAHDGTTGLVEITHHRPDVVLCDIGLPGMDGFAVASAIRTDPASAGIRLIALSGYGRDEDVRRALDAGFDGHLVKPADPEKLIRAIENLGGASG